MVPKDTSKIKEDILYFLKEKGPSLPVQISSFTRIDTLFISAFLSEMIQNQQIKFTSMKVGSSPVYYLSGTEEGLEKYSQYLKSKEREAFELLKKNKFLKDEIQEPAIRIALREIKDFAKPFEEENKIIWRYYLIQKEEYFENKKEEISYTPILEKPKEEKEIPKKEIISHNPNKELENQKEEKIPNNSNKELENQKEKIKIPKIEENSIFENPLAKKEKVEKKEKPYPEFIIKIKKFIESKNWEILEEIDYKAKEYNFLLKINSDLGPIIFKTQAKDKKTISENDFSKLLREAQSIPLPALIISQGNIQKKANELLNKFSSILKFKKLE